MNPILMDAAAVPTICGWLEWVKPMLPERARKFLPLGAVALGLLYAFAVRRQGMPITHSILWGIALGLTASGTWSAAKNMLEARKGE